MLLAEPKNSALKKWVHFRSGFRPTEIRHDRGKDFPMAQMSFKERKLPLWWLCKFFPCPADFASLKTEELWQVHDELCRQLRKSWSQRKFSNQSLKPSLLDLKIELTRRNYRNCTLCPWLCKVDRLKGEVGRCGLGSQSWFFRWGILVSEEPFIVPTCEIFLSGCNMRCKFCQAWKGIVKTKIGEPLTQNRFHKIVQHGASKGAKNVHFVGGEPTVNLLGVLNALQTLTEPIPVVWNTNLFVTEEAMKLLDSIVDIFLTDFKFGNDDCAENLSGAVNYVAVVQRNLLFASRTARLVIRHLVMPGHLDCCLESVAKWVAQTLPSVTFHLMLNYVPDWKAWDEPNLCRRLTEDERRRAKEIVKEVGLKKLLVSE